MRHARTDLEKIVLDALKRVPELKQEAPVLAWPLVCGRMVAERTTAVSFAQGKLTIRVPDAAWRAQLMGFIPQYLAVLNRTSGEEVKQIDFVILKH
jgi:Dna[CI] antecedent, DciA